MFLTLLIKIINNCYDVPNREYIGVSRIFRACLNFVALLHEVLTVNAEEGGSVIDS
jgi:hypothetical protein